MTTSRCSALISLALLAAPALAQEQPDTTLSPYFFVRSDRPEVDQLPLQRTGAKVDIVGVIADVRVTQVYKNEGRRPIEATYVFPASTRAAVYAMKMTIGERTIEAKIREREQARLDYESAKRAGRSASLLEQERPNVFQMNVANIMPGDEIEVEMSYTELLEPTDGAYSFVYPTVVGPRYSNKTVAEAQPKDKWIATPYTKAGEPPLAPFDLDLRIAAGMPIAKVTCESHETTLERESDSVAHVKLDDRFGGNRDFILKYELRGGGVQSGLLLHQGEKENFFLLMMQPPQRVTPDAIPQREFIFIMDVSGSMSGYPIETSKMLVKDLVANLRPTDLFNIVLFSGASATWSKHGSLPATQHNMVRALKFVDRQQGGGGTEIVPALKTALALPRAEGISRTVVIATDGYVEADVTAIDLIRDRLGEANMFAFGIGTSVNRFLIEGIAHAGQGEAFIVTKPKDAAAEAARFREYIASPVLTGIRLAFDGFEAYDVEPLRVPDVLAQRPVIAFGKWMGEPEGTIEVSGTTGGDHYEQRFVVKDAGPSAANAALRLLWARRRLQNLSDYARLGGEAQKEKIVALGLEYSLLTEFTSFVAVDKIVRNTTGEAESVSQPQPMPDGVSNYAISYPGPLTQAFDTTLGDVTAFANTLRVSHVRLGPLTADRRGLDLKGLAADIEGRLRSDIFSGLLRSDFVLTLTVSAAGDVTAVALEGSSVDAEAIRRLILRWRFARWGSGETVLRIPVRIR